MLVYQSPVCVRMIKKCGTHAHYIPVDNRAIAWGGEEIWGFSSEMVVRNFGSVIEKLTEMQRTHTITLYYYYNNYHYYIITCR